MRSGSSSAISSVKAGAIPTPRTFSPLSSQCQWSPAAVIRRTNGVRSATSAGSVSAAQIAARGAVTTASALVCAEKRVMPRSLPGGSLVDAATGDEIPQKRPGGRRPVVRYARCSDGRAMRHAHGGPMPSLRPARARTSRNLSILLAMVAGIAVLVAVPTPAMGAVNLRVWSYGPTTFSPNGDGQEDEVEFGSCPGATGTVSAVITDAAGDEVVSLGTETLDYAFDCPEFTWAGLDGEDAEVPDGDYVATLTADLSTGTGTATLDLTVDRRLPGTLTKPQAGSPLDADTVFEF